MTSPVNYQIAGQLCSCLCGCLERWKETMKARVHFKDLTGQIFMLAPFLLYFLTSLLLSLNSSSLFLSLRPSLLSDHSPPLHFLLLLMASSFLIFTAASSAVSVCSSILVLPIYPLSSPSAPPRGKTNFNLSLDQSLRQLKIVWKMLESSIQPPPPFWCV